MICNAVPSMRLRPPGPSILTHTPFYNEGTGPRVPKVTQQEVRDQDSIWVRLSCTPHLVPVSTVPSLQHCHLQNRGCHRPHGHSMSPCWCNPCWYGTIESSRPKVLAGTLPGLLSSISVQHQPLLKGNWGSLGPFTSN